MQTKNKILLHSSAVLALLQKAPGYDKIANVIATSAMSAVNLSEFVTVLTENNIQTSDIDEIIKDLVPEIIPFCQQISIKAGKFNHPLLAESTVELSLADRACLATGEHYQMEIYTTNKSWSGFRNVTVIG